MSLAKKSAVPVFIEELFQWHGLERPVKSSLPPGIYENYGQRYRRKDQRPVSSVGYFKKVGTEIPDID